jgi:hypothetical protein
VTWPQAGHSYAISARSPWTGAILTTSFIGVLQRGHARVPSLFAKSDTNAFHVAYAESNAGRFCWLRRRAHFTIRTFMLWNLNAIRAAFMPIRAYLDVHKFDGEMIRLMGIAFEMALASLRPTPDFDDPLRAALAQRIIALAQTGEHDPERLCEAALQAVSPADPSGGRGLAEGGGQAAES